MTTDLTKKRPAIKGTVMLLTEEQERSIGAAIMEQMDKDIRDILCGGDYKALFGCTKCGITSYPCNCVKDRARIIEHMPREK